MVGLSYPSEAMIRRGELEQGAELLNEPFRAAQARGSPLGHRPVGNQAQQAGRRRHGQQGRADRLGRHDPW